MVKPLTKIALAMLLLLFAATTAWAQDAPPTEKEIRALIGQLGSDKYEEREAAQRQLLEIAEDAEPFLQEALDAPDPEIRERAREILEKMKWHVDRALRAVLDTSLINDLEAFETKDPKNRGWILDRAIAKGKEKSMRFCLKVMVYGNDESVLGRAERAILLYATPKDIDAIERAIKVRERFALIKCLGLLCESAGDTERALKYLQKAHQADPKDYTVNRALAAGYERAGDWAKVAEFYKEMLALAPNGIRYLQRYGEALWNLGRKDEALAAWQLIVERNPNSESAHLLLADIYITHDRLDLAGKTLALGLGRFEEYRFPLRHAEILAAAGQKAQALAQLQLARDYAWREYEFAIIDEMIFRLCPSTDEQIKLMRDAAKAAENFEKAGKTAEALRNYTLAAAIARRQTLREDLLGYLEKLVPLLAKQPMFEFDGIADETADLYMSAERWDDAIKFCEAVLAARPDGGMVDRLGECWWRKGDKKKAIEIWARFVSTGRDGINRLDLYVEALYRHELYAEVVAAEKQYGGVVMVPDVLYRTGCAQLKLNRTEDALATFHKLIATFDDHHYAEMIAQALIDEGKADEARKFFATFAAARLDEVIKALMSEAEKLVAQRSSAWALRNYRMVIALVPGSPQAAEAQKRIDAIEGR